LIGGQDKTTKVLFLNLYGGMHDVMKIISMLTDSVKKNYLMGKPVVVRMKGLGADRATDHVIAFNAE